MPNFELEDVKWGNPTFGTAGGIVSWSFASISNDAAFYDYDASLTGSFQNYVRAAFDAWEQYANIDFVEVGDATNVDIRLGWDAIDGASGVVGECTYSYSNTSFNFAEIAFDSAENWNQINFYVVALHEIGHAIGLDHYNGSDAVMNTYVNSAVMDLTQSDIAGIQAIYGVSVGTNETNEIVGTPGEDQIVGGAANDIIYGLGGNDQLWGMDGNDVLIGGLGADVLNGGAGRDEIAYQTSESAVEVNLRDQVSLGGDAHGDRFGSIENIIGSSYSDQLTGDNADNWIYGLAGNDRLWGDTGNDILIGGQGADIMTGGSGFDSTSYHNSDVGVRVVLFLGTGRYGDAEGDLFGSIEEIIGSQHQDEIFGDNADNRLYGLGDHDTLEGASGDDLLEGGGGNDKLYGQDGNDVLDGGEGQDRLFGGAGADVFLFRSNSDSVLGTPDEIVEFTTDHGDKIDLSPIDANVTSVGDQAFSFIGSAGFSNAAGQLRYSGQFLEGDVDGNGNADFRIQLNAQVLASTDFIL